MTFHAVAPASAPAAGRDPSAVLVSLPWTTLTEPSLGLGLLKAVLAQHSIPSQVKHINLFILRYLHASTYFALSNVYALNDFLFSQVLDPEVSHKQHQLLREKVRELLDRGRVVRFGGEDSFVEKLLRLRNQIIPTFLGEEADEIAASGASLVGFTCMFDQTIASLALASLIRKRAPEMMLALGGYAVRPPAAEMLLKSSPWIDAVCVGEGEQTIVELAEASVGRRPLSEVSGIAYRSDGGETVETRMPPMVNLTENPTPNFDDFFIDIQTLASRDEVDIKAVYLPLENSRGCWWGQKHHCTFCGIRDSDMAFRWRPAEAVLKTMDELSRRYAVSAFRFSDYILPYDYYKTLLPQLAELGAPYRLFGEIKANVNEERFRLLDEAGFEEVQPGIESFSSTVLAKMAKGVSAIQNVHTLLMGRRRGVEIRYNLLYGFPDDELDEYERMVEWVRRIVHLDSPVSYVPVQITRYAPLQERPQDFGIDVAIPDPTFDLVFSERYIRESGFDVGAYCYYFQRPFENSSQLARVYAELQDIVEDWRLADKDQEYWLYAETTTDGAIIHDRRRAGEETVYPIDVLHYDLLLRCPEPTDRDALSQTILSSELNAAIAELDRLGLVVLEGEKVLSLLMPGKTPPRPTPYFLRSAGATPMLPAVVANDHRVTLDLPPSTAASRAGDRDHRVG
jgi:ribosomal peptide maturation radical SAM protein 1